MTCPRTGSGRAADRARVADVYWSDLAVGWIEHGAPVDMEVKLRSPKWQ